jgi:urocanate hydratase
VLIANPSVVGVWAPWPVFRGLENERLMMYGQMTCDSWVVQLVADVPGALHRAVRSVRS